MTGRSLHDMIRFDPAVLSEKMPGCLDLHFSIALIPGILGDAMRSLGSDVLHGFLLADSKPGIYQGLQNQTLIHQSHR